VGEAVLRAHACARECIVSYCPPGRRIRFPKLSGVARAQVDFLASNCHAVISSPYASASASRKASAAIIFIQVSLTDSLIFLATWMLSRESRDKAETFGSGGPRARFPESFRIGMTNLRTAIDDDIKPKQRNMLKRVRRLIADER